MKADYDRRHIVVQPHGPFLGDCVWIPRPQAREYGHQIRGIPTVNCHWDGNRRREAEQAHDKECSKQSNHNTKACFPPKSDPRSCTTYRPTRRRIIHRDRTTLQRRSRPTDLEKVSKGPSPTTKICGRILELKHSGLILEQHHYVTCSIVQLTFQKKGDVVYLDVVCAGQDRPRAHTD